MNEQKLQEIRYNIECLLQDWDILSYKDKKYRINSIQWKLNLAGFSKKKMRERRYKGRFSKTTLNNLGKGVQSN